MRNFLINNVTSKDLGICWLNTWHNSEWPGIQKPAIIHSWFALKAQGLSCRHVKISLIACQQDVFATGFQKLCDQVVTQLLFHHKSKYKNVAVLPIPIVKSRLYYPFRQYNNLFIFRFVSEHCLHSTTFIVVSSRES